MKILLIKFGLPIGMGMILIIITIIGLSSVIFSGCEEKTVECDGGDVCKGTNDHCYSCSVGSCSKTGGSGCSTPVSGVYCCNGGSGTTCGNRICESGETAANCCRDCAPAGGCSPPTPWLCGGSCYAEPPSGNHNCTRCN